MIKLQKAQLDEANASFLTHQSVIMKSFHIHTLLLWMLTASITGCSKQKNPADSANLTLVNAVVGTGGGLNRYLVPNFTPNQPLNWYAGAMQISYANSASSQTSSYFGKTPLAIYFYPDTTAHSTPLYNLTLNLPSGSINTLFLTGSLSNPDTLFTTDHPPYHPVADSSLGIRFVNLSAGSSPVSFNISGQANGSEASSLPYKGITSFKNYSAIAGISDYNFECRDAATGTLISSFDVSGIADPGGTTPNNRRYRNFTLALIGSPGTPGSQQLVLIETYTTI